MNSQLVKEVYGWSIGDEKETTVGDESIVMLILIMMI